MADVLCPVVVGTRTASSAFFARHSTRRGAAKDRSSCSWARPASESLGWRAKLIKEADAAGMVVLRGRAVPRRGQGPVSTVGRGAGAGGGRARSRGSTLDPWLPALAAVVPGLRAPHPGPGDASDAARGESVVRALSSLVDGRGGLLVLEDLHWADPDTLAVVEHLTGQLVSSGRHVPGHIAFRGAQQRS